MATKSTEKKAALEIHTRTAGLTLLEIMVLLEQDGYSWKLHSRSSGGLCRYRAQVYRMDDGGGGRYTFSQSPVEALTEAWASAARWRVRSMIQDWKKVGEAPGLVPPLTGQNGVLNPRQQQPERWSDSGPPECVGPNRSAQATATAAPDNHKSVARS